MRQITVKYSGVCSRCGADLEVGTSAMYEKTTGIFCVGCEPIEPEDIRRFRIAKAEKRAARLEAKASRLDRLADQKQSAFNHYRKDIAWLTQPGHIPGRRQALDRYDKGFELRAEAEAVREKAENVMLYKTRVKGDAARRDEERRAAHDALLGVGSRVFDYGFGNGTITKVYKKSYRVKWDRTGSEFSRDKIYCRPLVDTTQEVNHAQRN